MTLRMVLLLIYFLNFSSLKLQYLIMKYFHRMQISSAQNRIPFLICNTVRCTILASCTIWRQSQGIFPFLLSLLLRIFSSNLKGGEVDLFRSVEWVTHTVSVMTVLGVMLPTDGHITFISLLSSPKCHLIFFKFTNPPLYIFWHFQYCFPEMLIQTHYFIYYLNSCV